MALHLKKSAPLLKILRKNERQFLCRCFPSKGFSTTAPSASNNEEEEEEEELKAMYEAYLVQHKKFYRKPEEKEKRFQIFKNTLNFIDHHNSTHPYPYSKVGLNSIADISIEEVSNPVLSHPITIQYMGPIIWPNKPVDPVTVTATTPSKKKVRNKVTCLISLANKGLPPPSSKDQAFSTLDDEQVKALYEAFLVKHNKVYDTREEKERRFKMFKGTLRFIDYHNSTNPYPPSKLRLTNLADMSQEDIRNLRRQRRRGVPK